jgi:hypothetical protein
LLGGFRDCGTYSRSKVSGNGGSNLNAMLGGRTGRGEPPPENLPFFRRTEAVAGLSQIVKKSFDQRGLIKDAPRVEFQHAKMRLLTKSL